MTIIKSIEEVTIFESPDGGKTIYSRKSGQTERTLIQEDPDKKNRDRWLEWRDILEASKDNTALADLIEKAETIWHLTKNP
jgi:hypothetical protein